MVKSIVYSPTAIDFGIGSSRILRSPLLITLQQGAILGYALLVVSLVVWELLVTAKAHGNHRGKAGYPDDDLLVIVKHVGNELGINVVELCDGELGSAQ